MGDAVPVPVDRSSESVFNDHVYYEVRGEVQCMAVAAVRQCHAVPRSATAVGSRPLGATDPPLPLHRPLFLFRLSRAAVNVVHSLAEIACRAVERAVCVAVCVKTPRRCLVSPGTSWHTLHMNHALAATGSLAHVPMPHPCGDPSHRAHHCATALWCGAWCVAGGTSRLPSTATRARPTWQSSTVGRMRRRAWSFRGSSGDTASCKVCS